MAITRSFVQSTIVVVKKSIPMSSSIARTLVAVMLTVTLSIESAAAQEFELSTQSVVASGSSTANAASTTHSVSSDGRWVLIGSTATNLVTGQSDTSNSADVFLRDRTTGTTILVSRAAGTTTTTANGESFPRAVSDDGRYVVFLTLATNLVAGVTDNNSAYDIYLFDRQNGTNRLVSHAAASTLQTGNASSFAFDPTAIDATGVVVVFHSYATDLVAGLQDTNGDADIFLFDTSTNTRTLVSRSASNPASTSTNSSLPMQISPGGRYVLFISSASDLVAGVTDTNGTFDAFLFDRQSSTSELLSSAAGQPNQAANSQLNNAVMSLDARWVVMNTRATNMIANQVDGVGTDDVFLLDRSTGSRRLLSGVNGSQITTMGALQTVTPRQLSADGRFFVISTQGTNLVAGVTDNNSANDLYLFDRIAGSTSLISGANGSTTVTASGLSRAARLSQDGAWLMFTSQGTNLKAGLQDTNGGEDVFMLETGSRQLTALSVASAPPETAANGSSAGVAMNADGSVLVLDSTATNLPNTPTDANLATDVFAVKHRRNVFGDGFE